MLEHLTEAGFNYVAHNEQWIIVQDPRHSNYRVYSANLNPEDFNNAWIEAERYNFDLVVEAAEFAGISH